MRIYIVNASVKPPFTFAMMKKNCIFLLSFILYLNIAKLHVYIMQSFQLQNFLFNSFFLFKPLIYFSRLCRTSRAVFFKNMVNTL